jgi:hypothetical protein
LQKVSRLPVVTHNVRRIDTEFLGSYFGVPAVGEGFPRTRHLFDLEFSEVRLEQLLLVVAELHVEVTVEAAFGILLDGLHDGESLFRESFA